MEIEVKITTCDERSLMIPELPFMIDGDIWRDRGTDFQLTFAL